MMTIGFIAMGIMVGIKKEVFDKPRSEQCRWINDICIFNPVPIS